MTTPTNKELYEAFMASLVSKPTKNSAEKIRKHLEQSSKKIAKLIAEEVY